MTVPLLATIVACGALVASFILLITLTIIDFKARLLPNKYVFPFAILGPVFHASIEFSILDFESLIIGGALGYGLLYAIRAGGNWYYKQESLGLGDVKLMGAAGLWLGAESLMIAITLGATVSVVHGLLYAFIKKKSLRRLEIPAGPGLIAGIVMMQIWMLKDLTWIPIYQ